MLFLRLIYVVGEKKGGKVSPKAKDPYVVLARTKV